MDLCLYLDHYSKHELGIIAFLVQHTKWNDNKQLRVCSACNTFPSCTMNLWCMKMFDPEATWSNPCVYSWCNLMSVGWNVAPTSSAYFIIHFWFHQFGSADFSSRRTITSTRKSEQFCSLLLFSSCYLYNGPEKLKYPILFFLTLLIIKYCQQP